VWCLFSSRARTFATSGRVEGPRTDPAVAGSHWLCRRDPSTRFARSGQALRRAEARLRMTTFGYS
jgi:hypothetical protein